MQPIELDEDGVARFAENRIVRELLRTAEANGYTLNDVAVGYGVGRFTGDEIRQFMQLIGYSVSGYGCLSFAKEDPASLARADALAARAEAGWGSGVLDADDLERLRVLGSAALDAAQPVTIDPQRFLELVRGFVGPNENEA